MKPHGLLFRAEMILPLLNTQPDVWPAQPIDPAKPFKWQTRRGIKKPTWGSEGIIEADPDRDDTAIIVANETGCFADINCPHPVGQIVYAKEAWRTRRQWDSIKKTVELPVAEDVKSDPEWSRGEYISYLTNPNEKITLTGRKRNAMFMQPWMSRLWFVVKRVRVERVNQISEADCIAEGIFKDIVTVGREHGRPDYDVFALKPGNHCDWEMSGRAVYKKLFDRINGDGAFDRGDWCWVYDLARITRNSSGL